MPFFLGVLASVGVASYSYPHSRQPAGMPPELPPQGRQCNGNQSDSPWCDTSKPIAERVAALIAALTMEEKAGLFVNAADPVPRLDIPHYDWWNEAVHGFARVQTLAGSVHVNATSFPMSIGMAASFNKTLWRSIGDVVGREARGAANANLYHTNALTFWAPNINIARDSRWGGNQETPGEDPYTNSEYANALVTGMQGDDPTWLQISACAKHFAVHSWNTPSNYMAYPTAQDLADTYFPAFQAAAEAGVSGFMCSYNGVNGLPMCAQHDLLAKVRNEWNFSGYVTSDCGAVGGPWYKSNNWTSAADQVQQSFAAGMDTDCGGGAFSSTEMLAVLDTHPAIRAQADVALTHLLTVQFRLGMFEKPHDAPGGSDGGGSSQPAWSKYGQEQINTAQNRNLVLEAAQQGLVLLKNAKPTDGGGGGRGGASGLGLPLDSTAIKSLALVGPNVHNIVTHDCKKPLRQEPSYLGCEGCYCANAIDPVNPQQGFAMHTSRINFTAGCSDIHCEADSAQWSMAAAAAAHADATVAIMGLDVTQECEGLDRRDVSMPGGQNEFTSLVCAAAAVGGKPCIVLIMSGSAVDSSAIESNPNVTAVVWVGYPGERGGEAIANAVFGMHDSFGRLPFSIYRSAYYEPYCPNAPGTAACNGLSPLDFSMRPNASTHNPGRTYRFYKGANMLHPFGYGLSYNAWHLGEAATSVAGSRGLHGVLQLARLESAATGGDAQTSEEAATVSVQAWHSGRFAQSSTVVMCYATPPTGYKRGGRQSYQIVGWISTADWRFYGYRFRSWYR